MRGRRSQRKIHFKDFSIFRQRACVLWIFSKRARHGEGCDFPFDLTHAHWSDVLGAEMTKWKKILIIFIVVQHQAIASLFALADCCCVTSQFSQLSALHTQHPSKWAWVRERVWRKIERNFPPLADGSSNLVMEGAKYFSLFNAFSLCDAASDKRRARIGPASNVLSSQGA